MYLNKLEIFGFKSFAQKSVFKFDNGLTAIIGPNGCGKSNIVDAIRWVLGEQRPSILRCERMENVIFNGTANRKPLSVSEVSMLIENTKKILPSEYTELKVTRRLYRSGDSEYLINNQQVRLMDIINMFADTGMGADAYSVIELKMVEQILSDNAEERRRLFEEAAGIKKYKIRRKSALRKLDTTRQELVRLEDIISEIQKNVNSLSRQVGKARRYHQYNDELKKKDFIITKLKIRAYENDLNPLQMEFDQIKRSKENLIGDVQTEEAQIEKLQAQVVEMEHSYRGIATRLHEADENIYKFQQERQLRLQKNESLKERIAADKNEIKIQQQRIKDLDSEQKQIQGEIEKNRNDLKKVESQYKKSQESHQKMESEYRSVRDEYQQFVQTNVQQFRDTDKNKEAFQKIKIEEENLNRSLEKNQVMLNQLQNSLKEKEAGFQALQKQIANLKQNYDNEQADLDKLNQEVQQLRSNQETLHTEINKIEGQQDKVRNRRDFLEKLIENYEGFSESVQYIMAHRAEFEGLVDTLANLISIGEQYRTAVESYLAEASSYLLVKDLDTARKILQHIRDNDKGRLTLLPLPLIADSNFNDQPATNGKLLPMKDVVSINQEYQSLFNQLFKNVYLVDDVDAAIRMHAENPQLIYVTQNGEVLGSRGNLTIGKGSNLSLVGRKQQFEESAREFETISQILENKKVELNDLAAGLDQKQDRLNEKAEQNKQMEKEISLLEKESDHSEYEISRLKESIGEIENEAKSLWERQKQLAAEEKQLLPKIREMDDNIQTYQLKEKEILEDQKIQEARLKEMAEATQKLQIEFLNLTSRENESNQRLEFIEQNKKHAANYIETRRQHIQQSELEIENLTSESEGEEEQLNSAYEKRDLIETQRNDLEKRLNNLKSTIQDQDAELKNRQRLLNEARERLQRLELQIKELQVKKTALQEQMTEKYGSKALDFEQEKLEPSLTLPQVQAEIEALKEKLERLGDVNPLAIKEHEKEKERLDFLKDQRADLLAAEEQLLETIHKLNTTARKEFMNAFGQIRENFRKVFGEFFQGGQGDLILIESRDPLEANIDFSIHHKGRQLHTLSLLSAGEKTLTAISLLFAIYLVKPSPFCILDEVDAPLDDVNIGRYTQAIRRFSKETQFILVTHNKRTIEATQSLYGITMEEPGVSKVVSVRLD